MWYKFKCTLQVEVLLFVWICCSLMIVTLQSLIGSHENFKRSLGDTEKAFSEIIGICNEVKKIAQQHNLTNCGTNPYTTVSEQVRISSK